MAITRGMLYDGAIAFRIDARTMLGIAGLPYSEGDAEWQKDWLVPEWHAVHSAINAMARITYRDDTLFVRAIFRAAEREFVAVAVQRDPMMGDNLLGTTLPEPPKKPVDPLLEAVLTGLGLGDRK
jgi:hypothetical protein